MIGTPWSERYEAVTSHRQGAHDAGDALNERDNQKILQLPKVKAIQHFSFYFLFTIAEESSVKAL